MKSLLWFSVLGASFLLCAGCHRTWDQGPGAVSPQAQVDDPYRTDLAREEALYRDPTVREHRPRLSRVITLGQTTFASSSPQTEEVAAGSSPVVIHNHISIENDTYVGGWGYGYGPWRPSLPHRPGGGKPPSSNIEPGDDWPDVPDHGPQFPISAVPAP
jgi:hypothetical protein